MAKQDKATIQAITEVKGDTLLAIASDETVDRAGDKIKVADWDFKNFLKNPVLQAGHDYNPQFTIGVAKDIRVEGKKVLFTPVFHDITQLAREISKMYKEKFLTAWSVGFIPAKEDGDTHELLEVSAVAVPANPNAVTMVKGLEKEAKEYDDNVVKEIEDWTKKSDKEDMDVDEKPFENFHACRLRNPDSFQEESFKTLTRTSTQFKKKYNVIVGKLKGEDTTIDQSFKYNKESWKESQAKKHCSEHDGKLFEPAIKEEKVEKARVEKETGETDDHTHIAIYDSESGNGDTDTSVGHIHLIKNFKVQEAKEHTHSLAKSKSIEKSVIPFADHGIASEDNKWNEEKEIKAANTTDLLVMSAWFDNENPDLKESYKFPHHKAEGTHVAVFKGVESAMEELLKDTGISNTDRKKIYRHLEKHYEQYDKEVPEFKETKKPKKKEFVRWNKSLSKDFDVEDVVSEPAGFENKLYTKFLGKQIKNVFINTYSIPSPLLGSYLSAFKEVLKDLELVDTRNFNWSGSEEPPIHNVIQLNSEKSDDFLIIGTNFYKKDDKNHLIIKFQPTWTGLGVQIISRESDKKVNKEVLENVHKWVKKNNYLKNEKFCLGGQFLEKGTQTWDDLVINHDDKNAIKKSVGLIEKKGIDFNSRGILLVGPPGTGKTMSGKIIMNQVDSTFIWVSSRDFQAGPIGAMSLAFKLARDLAPSILFMEDIDTWLKSYTVDLMKTELDGIQQNKGSVTILTSNFPENLPDALLDRPGRFHDVLELALPDKVLREKMIKTFLGVKEISKEILDYILEKSEGFSGAHLKEIVDFAKMLADDEDDKDIAKYLKKAIDKIVKQRELIGRIKDDDKQKNEKITKVLEELEVEVKEGRIISKKNKKVINNAIDSQKNSIEALEKLLNTSEVVDTPVGDTPEKDVSSKKAHSDKEIIVHALQKIAGNSSYLLSKIKKVEINKKL